MNKEELLKKLEELENKYNNFEIENCDRISCNENCHDCKINIDKGQLYGEILKLKEELELKNKDEQIEEWKNKYFYLQADLENIRKRDIKQVEYLKKYEGENIFKDLLEIFDNLDYSVNDDIDILNTYKALLKILNKYEVELIYDDERPIFFNSEYDEAIASVKTDDPKLDNSIHKIYKKGFFFKDKILRFEKVIVNKYEA